MLAVIEYQTQKIAIDKAIEDAKFCAESFSKTHSEIVLLVSGDSLIVTSTPEGKISTKKTSGWIKTGLVHVPKKISSMIY